MTEAEKKKTGNEGTPEVDRDIRVDEAWKANLKMLFDQTVQALGTTHSQLQKELATLNAATQQGINTMVENNHIASKNLIANTDALMKQHLAHRDIATDCTWSPGPGEESLITKNKAKKISERS